MYTRSTYRLFLFFILQHLEHHSNHFCPVSCDEVSQDTVSYDRAAFACMARQWWKGGVAKQSECLKDPPCQLPFTVTLATTHLADRWPGKCILQKLERPDAQYPFSKNGQVSRALHEKRVKYIPTTKVGGIEQASCRDEKIILVGAFIWLKTQAAKMRSTGYYWYV